MPSVQPSTPVCTGEMYEMLWNVSYDSLKQNCFIAGALMSMMQKRADNLRSQLSFPVAGGSKTFINEFREAFDELQSMATSVQGFVGEWQALFMDEKVTVCEANIATVVDVQFDYTKQPLVYEKGQIVDLLVTDTSNTSPDIFLAVDQSHSSKLGFLVKLQMVASTLSPLAQLPSSGKVFAIRLENVWFRAVRNRPGCNGDEDKTNIAICLLDSGEVLPYQETFCIAELPDEFQTIPSYVIKCRLVSSGGYSAALEQFGVISCKVVKVEDEGVLSVEQLPKTPRNDEPVQDTILKNEPVSQPTEEPISQNASEVEAPQPVEQQQQLVNNEPTNAGQVNGETQSPGGNKRYEISRETLSEEQLAQFDEYPESTTNAIKAIFGYVPKDDEEICKFYDPKTKGCFKGGNCSKRHIEMDPNGWTRDRDTVIVGSMLRTMEVPAPNTIVKLVPTMVIDMDLFYAHLVPPGGINKEFNQLSADLNNPELVEQYKPLKLLPAVGELVLAKYENEWYRAQVCELSDQLISVFYIDYGNQESLPMDAIRKCPDRFKYLPQQAVACRLANAATTKVFHAEAIEQLTAALLDKHLDALVVDNKTPWEVQIFDEDGFDIGHGMILAKLAKPRTASKIDDQAKIPG